VSQDLREMLTFAALGAAIVAGWFLLNGMSDELFWSDFSSRSYSFRARVMKQALFGGLIGGAIGAITAIARNVLKRDK
jgi:hypothetical protein